jgi:hypothetical protein
MDDEDHDWDEDKVYSLHRLCSWCIATRGLHFKTLGLFKVAND